MSSGGWQHGHLRLREQKDGNARRLPWPFCGRPRSPRWSYGWCSGLSAAAALVQAQVVKHADEAANGHQIFIRPGTAAPLYGRMKYRGTYNHFVPSLTSFTLTAAAVSSEGRRISEDAEKRGRFMLFNLGSEAKVERVGSAAEHLPHY